MKRRDFLKISGLTGSTLLVPGFLKAFEGQLAKFTGKRLVIVQLSGGNDGLNTLIPFTNDNYYKLRPKLGITQDKVLKINDTAGFNPSMDGFRKLYDEGLMSIFNAVGYPNPDRSHFRSMDIWHTASNADEYLNTGWIGRLLDANCPGSENAWHALEVDDTLSLAMKGLQKSGFAVKDPQRLQQITRDPFLAEIEKNGMASESTGELSFLYKTLAQTTSSANYIAEKAGIKTSTTVYPQHELGNSLKQIAELISAGMESGVYYTSISGFDTHVRQAESQNRLLGVVSDSIYAFTKDLREANALNDTLVVVFSEFGRRVKQNASNGTDHGTANNLYVIGGSLKKPGMQNGLVSLTDLDDGDLKHTLDFRKVYATLLNKGIGFNHEQVLGRKFDLLDFI
ncbi:MAG: hypothetical protein RL092_1337 [Bacteroidota bacterium]|jgi:uncharacterized protein (DUF1501 family)